MDLPSGYTQLEYIESTGTQYIDTGFIPNQDTRFVLTAELTAVSDSSQTAIFGSRNANKNQFWLYWRYNNLQFAFRYGNSTTNNLAGNTALTAHVFDANKNVFSVSGEAVTAASATFECLYSAYIFAVNNGGVAEYQSSLKLYSCQIYDNGVLVREFVPCKNSGDVGGLYDVLNGVFYGNAGTGEFLLGKEIDVDPNPEPIPPEEFPTMIYDRTYTDLARAKELAVVGYANMTDAEREEWNGGLRGAYNAIDFNRVENAVLFLCVVLKELPQEIRDFAAELGVSWDGFFDVPYSTDALNLTAKNTWKVGEIPTKEEKSRYLSNVVELRRTLDYETDMLPTSMDVLTIDGANAIEKALAFLHTEIDKFRQMRKTQLENTVAAWFYADEIYANEVQ